MADALRRKLMAQKLRTGRKDGELVFRRTAQHAFVPSTVRLRALDA
jgi:hypothetical protein